MSARRPRPPGTLDRRVEVEQAVERALELVGCPAGGLLRELLGPERVELEHPRQLADRRPGRDEIGHLEQLAQPPMELDEDDRLGRRVENPLEQVGRIADPAQGDRVEQRPGRRRDRPPRRALRRRRAVDRGVEPVEGELVELLDGQLALAPAVDVALADEPADPVGQRLCRTAFRAASRAPSARSSIQRAIPPSVGAGIAADLAAGRLDRPGQRGARRRSVGRPSGSVRAASTKTRALPGATIASTAIELGSRPAFERIERTRVGDDRQGPAAEHRAGGDPLADERRARRRADGVRQRSEALTAGAGQPLAEARRRPARAE